MSYITCIMACCTFILAPDAEWTPQDATALKTAQAHCKAEPRRDSRCLIKFKKVEEAVYDAICGKDNN